MSVYEAIGVCKEKSNKLHKKINIQQMLRHICCLGLGVLFSLSGFDGRFSPFGVAFVACVSGKYTLTATVGACVGYFVALDSMNALRYTASVLAAAVIITSLSAFRKIRTHPIMPIIISGVCLLVTGVAVVLSQGVTAFNFMIVVCEVTVGGAAAFVFGKTKAYLTIRGGLSVLTSREITSMIITLSLLLLSLRYASIGNISLARIIAVFLILVCAFYGKEAGGAVVGICCGLAMSVGSDNLFTIAFYSLGGLLCGAASSFGRMACIGAFSLSGLLIAVVSGCSVDIASLLVELVASCMIFLILTQRFNYQLYNFFVPSVSSPVVESVRNNVIDKLHRASEFSSEICTTLENVNEILAKSDKIKADNISIKIKNTVCSSCGLYDTCWGEMREEMCNNFNELLQLKKQGSYIEYKNAPASFSSACIKAEKVYSSFNKMFSEYKLKEKAETRIKEIQTLATEQFTNVSSLLDSLCDEMHEEVSFDMDIATRCKAVAVNSGMRIADCTCIRDNLDRVSVELRIIRPVTSKEITDLIKQLSTVAAREFDTPRIDEFDDYVKAVFREKPPIKVVSHGVQFNANGEKYSGDAYAVFTDSKGWVYGLICDGMSTGAKAAVCSNLAVDLLKKLIMAGFGIEAAINTVNTSLVSKSGDECSVTLDLTAIDTNTGRAEFYKCGAQDTLVKHSGRISDIGYDSLPLGILSNIDISSGNGSVSSGDIIVMSSDGVREEDLWQLRNALKVFNSGDVRGFTEDVAGIIRRSQPAKNDDLTLLTLAIAKEQERYV